MKAKEYGTAFLTAGILLGGVACSTTDTPSAGATWQVTNIYLDGTQPSTIPSEVAGLVVLSFGSTTLTGFSGCSQFQATTHYDDDSSDIRNAHSLTIADIAFDPIEEECQGPARYTHEHMLSLLQPGEFKVSHPSNDSLKLTVQSDEHNAEHGDNALELVSESAPPTA